MLIAIDIGNTNISCGIFRKNKLKRRMSFKSITRNMIKDAERIICVSVSPKRLKEVRKRLNGHSKKLLIIGKDICVPLKSKYNSRQIGQDRLVTAFAASFFYGNPVLTIDFGTAATFDVLSKDSVYVGGLILPGIKMSLEGLKKNTAMLPEVELKKIHGFIGTNTEDSIRNGIIYGYVSICEGLIKRFKKIFPGLKIVATGGNAKLIKMYTNSIPFVDDDLSLKGLNLLSSMASSF